MPEDEKRAFELAAAGVAMDCAHSKGALGDRYVFYPGSIRDKLKGLCSFVVFVRGRESAAAGGSCFGQDVVEGCYCAGWGVPQDYE